MMRLSARGGLTLAVVVPVVLAGCSGGIAPGAEEAARTPAMSSVPSPSTTETAAAEAESPQDFIRRWVREYNRMQDTGDAGRFLAISSRCGPCRDVAEAVETAHAAGGFYRTEGLRLLSVEDRTSGTGPLVLDVRTDAAPTAIKDGAGRPIRRLPGGRAVFRFRLSRSEPWQVVGLTQVPS